MKFNLNFKTSFHDIDASRVVSPSALFRYLQETANEHFFAVGPSFDCLRDELGLGFVLSRLSLDMYEPIKYCENVTVTTWTSLSKGYAFNRCFEIARDGKPVGRAYSIWALLDLKAAKPVRIEDHDFGFESETPIETAAPIRFRIPNADALEKVGEKTVLYSDIDCNMHMNNTNYPNMLCDYIPDIEKRRIKAVSLSWAHEAHFGTALDIYRLSPENEPNTFYFRVCEKGSSIKNALSEARIETELGEIN